MNKITGEEYESLIQLSPVSGMTELVVLSGKNCKPCAILKKTLLEIEKDYPFLHFSEIDVFEEHDCGALEGVSSVPKVIIYEDGEIISEFTGNRHKAKVKEILDKLLDN